MLTSWRLAIGGSDPSSMCSPTLFNALITAVESMASRITACPISNEAADDVELPRTITTLCISSMPADVDATDENRSNRRRTCSSSISPSISPRATATPSADAPREYAIEPYAHFVTVLLYRADATSTQSHVKSGH